MPHLKWARCHDDFTFRVLLAPANASTNMNVEATSAAPPISTTSSRNNDISDVDNIAEVRLWLPSDLPVNVRHLVASPEIIATEHELLIAEMHDCLVAIRKYRRALSVIRNDRRGNWQATSQNAAALQQRDQVSGVGDRIETNRVRYNDAWDSLQRLDPGGEWSLIYQKLEKADIRGPLISDDLTDILNHRMRFKGPVELGQGTYVPSWIWQVQLSKSTEPTEALRVHWIKAMANRDRWMEQLVLVPEEMRRTLTSLLLRVQWWKGLVGTRPTELPALRDALDAHALRQSYIFQQRAVVFATAWLPYLKTANLGLGWTSQFAHLVPPEGWQPRKRGAPLGCTYLVYL
jgi:hypothetical protein